VKYLESENAQLNVILGMYIERDETSDFDSASEKIYNLFLENDEWDNEIFDKFFTERIFPW